MPEISILLIILIFTIGALLKGWSGFGTNLIVPPLLMFIGYDIKIAIIITISTNIILNIAMLIENKKFNIKNLNDLKVLVILGIIFNFVGVYFLKNMDASWLKVILGMMIILVSLNKLFKWNFQIKNPEKYYVPTGIVSGLLNGMSGIGGLPVLILLSSTEMDKDKFKTTLVSYFFVMNIIAIIGYVSLGLYSTYIFTNISIVLLPSVIICLFGVYLSRRVNDKIFQQVMVIILFIMGLNLIYNGFFNEHIFNIFVS